MAGIGFELKKLFQQRSLFRALQGFSHGTLVSVGPMLISIIMLLCIGKILKAAQVPVRERELLVASIMYAYIFSMIIVSGLTMLVTRYIADKLYVNRREDILSSLAGVLAVGLLLAGTLGALFYFRSPLPWSFKLPAYIRHSHFFCHPDHHSGHCVICDQGGNLFL